MKTEEAIKLVIEGYSAEEAVNELIIGLQTKPSGPSDTNKKKKKKHNNMGGGVPPESAKATSYPEEPGSGKGDWAD